VNRIVFNAILKSDGASRGNSNPLRSQKGCEATAGLSTRSTMTRIDKAVVLAAGRGTRMRELTAKLPKPMIEVHSKPVLQHILEGLRNAGIGNLLFVVGYRADAVREFFGDGSHHKVAIQYVTQTAQDGTGRVVELARDFIDKRPFILAYGDILVEPANYGRLADLPDGVEAALTVTRGEDVSKGGAVFLNREMELVDLREKPKPGEPTSSWYNAGLYAFRPSILDFTAKLKLSSRGEYELTDAIRDLAHSGKKVKALELTGEWADVRDPEILARLNSQL
jgi:UDP-N-acetylglucosamine diphosphorylase / glucose-1-phosphate thymidylyltransferase / UDP-N-acetylgalactosamine diphosphorylase / glucosamine-1-phosphate N-acetyltransferase / galactosamine-1-phosphate N-acetyltransferase